MSREIKFRAWDKTRKTMLRVELWDFNKGVDNVDKDGKGYYTENFENLEIMQFTGLLDKLGKEIFEGDIVKYKTEDNHEFAEEVVFENGAFYPISEDCYEDQTEDFEVIGNIYENANLLQDNQKPEEKEKI